MTTATTPKPTPAKTILCDGYHKMRRNVRSVGRDANGEPDAPDLCFLCRKESDRGRARGWAPRGSEP
jgi:hypothetical protein